MLQITYTKHAALMLAERQIDLSWVAGTIDNPETTEPDPVYPQAVRAFRAIPENGGRILRVVYVAEGGVARVITAFFDRSRRK